MEKNKWHSMSMIMLAVGFGIILLVTTATRFADDTTDGLMITGFLCYLLALIMILILHHGVVDSKIIAVLVLIASILACVFIVGAFGMWRDNQQFEDYYKATLMITSVVLAGLGGAFALISLCMS